jgi:hypothetical protein
MWLLGAATASPLILLLVLLVVGVNLRGIWAKGWVLLGEVTAPPASEPMSSWLRDRSEFVGTLLFAILALVAISFVRYRTRSARSIHRDHDRGRGGCLALFRRIGG